DLRVESPLCRPLEHPRPSIFTRTVPLVRSSRCVMMNNRNSRSHAVLGRALLGLTRRAVFVSFEVPRDTGCACGLRTDDEHSGALRYLTIRVIGIVEKTSADRRSIVPVDRN